MTSEYTSVKMDEKKPKSDYEDHELEEPFDEKFWSQVQKTFSSKDGISWSRAMDEVRTERLIATYGKKSLLVIIRNWPVSERYKNQPELVASLEYLISRFAEIMLEKDSIDEEEEYKYFRDEDDPACRTLLHLAASQNFLHVSRCLVKYYSSLVYLETEVVGDERAYLPVELALKDHNDETAAFLISQMKQDWVHELFLYDDELKKAKFSFPALISHRDPITNLPDMKKTVVAVLDRLINPHWPYLPEQSKELGEKSERIERAWSSVPDDPMNYDFLYHVLDADHEGRQPKIKGIKNKNFNSKSKSCLRCLTESENKEAIQHPVVRLLVMRKWNKFGHWWFCIQALLYVFFLIVLSYALLHGSTRDDPTQYNDAADRLRLFCEILSIIYIVFFMFEEIDQADRDSSAYFKDPYNYIDWLAIILTFLVIPLRFAEANAQWSVAALGYLFNFLRLFKYSCVTRTTGLYTKTLAKIIYRDISRFMAVFVVVCIGFCGAMFMALKATGSQDMFSNYAWLMLAAVRVLSEQQPVEEDYSKFSWLIILILLGYMTMVIVVLLNVLIAQLSDTYKEAKNIAKLQYAIHRMFIVTRLEQSRFGSFNLRVKYYEEGDRVSETDLVEEMLEYSEERHPWESMEDKLTLIRDLMRNVIRKASNTSE